MDEAIIIEIVWTDSAKVTFDKIVEYLYKEWTEKEVEKFISRVTKMLETLKRYLEICRPSTKRKNVRIGIVNKHTQIVYHHMPQKKRIEILLFWNSKQDPSKFKY